MSSSNPTQPEMSATSTVSSERPTDLLLGLMTAPVLLGVLATGAVVEWLQSAGVASEEIFRGDRLPVLPVPDTSD